MKTRLAVACMLASMAAFAVTGAAQDKKMHTPEDWAAWEEKYDYRDIRFSPDMHPDTSERFLDVPDGIMFRDFDMAAEAPTIEIGIVQGYEPWYFPFLYHENYRLGGIWEGYGDVTSGPDGCFYFSIGDHRSYNGNAYIVRYDPELRAQSIVFDLRKLVGWTPDDFADGKLHGDLDIGPGGDMWALSYFGPGPSDREWDTNYRGSRLIRFNIFSGEAEDLGIPIEGESWPYHNYDWERGLFFGVSHKQHVLVYDTIKREKLWAGACPDGILWNARAVMVDRDTGVIYTTDQDGRFVSYRRRNNEFTRMKAMVPVNPSTGKRGGLRAHTTYKDANGAFWCFSGDGTFFTFDPAKDATELVGLNWGDKGTYIPNMCFSPGKRYIYYTPRDDRYPVVQYDTRTGRRKVLAFILDYYQDTYGYAPGSMYGLELSRDGESLFFYTGGGFRSEESGLVFRRPAMFHVHIPESERQE